MAPPAQPTIQNAHDSCSESMHPQLCALNLPPELVDMVFMSLDGPTQVCFALTCQTLYGDYFLKTLQHYWRGSNRYHIRELLYQLEKGNPHSYYCVQRKKLRRWDVSPQEDWSPRKQWKGCLRLERPDDQDYLCFPIGEDNHLTFHALRIIMNRHLYGPEHGIPLEEIELDTSKRCPETGTSVDMSMRPRIIDDELYLSVRYKVFHPQEDTESLQDFVNSARWRVCRHLQIGKFWDKDECWVWRENQFLPHRIPEMDPRRFPPRDGASEVLGDVRSCSICMTDYQVKVSRQRYGQEEMGWSIEILTWHQLGNGRDPLDGGPWFNLACEGYAGGKGRQSPPGIVRHRWSKGDGALLDVEGEFVEGMDDLPGALRLNMGT